MVAGSSKCSSVSARKEDYDSPPSGGGSQFEDA